MIFRFDRFEVDDTAFRLTADCTSVSLEPKALRLLLYLIQNRGRLVRKQELLDAVWANTVVTESALTRSIGLLRKVLDDDSREPIYIETVPTAGYRFIAHVEETAAPEVAAVRTTPQPAGPIVETVLPAAQTGKRHTPSRSHLRLASILGVCLILLAAVSLLLAAHFRPVHIHSVAVLPLDNLSGDPAQAYFADGMTEELTTMLAKYSTLRVVARSAAMQEKGAHKPPREMAREMGVDGIVEGSVERSGGKVHLTLELIGEPAQGAGDTHVWSESYDRDAGDAVTLPREAAMEIAGRTRSAAAGPAPEQYVNPEAHDAYLHGRYLWVAGRNDGAEKYFVKAVALQPDYALAWTGIADFYGQGMVVGAMDPREARQPFEVAAEKAVELDGSLAQTHLTLCAATFFTRWDLTGADRECQRAIDLDPKLSDAYHMHAKVLIALNRDEEAIASQKKAMEIDPFARPWGLAFIYVLTRHYDEAIREAHQRLESSPHDAVMLLMLSSAYRCKGMYAEAVKAREESLIAGGNQTDAESIRRAFAQGGYRAVVRWNLDRLKRRARTHYVSPVDMALASAQLGDREQTLGLLDEAYRRHSPLLLVRLQSDPAYDFLHRDARYRALIRQIGLPPKY
ncbi:MAG TPA: winged helix-turn-helix domain-containing protein [Terracidiphilus sp.]|nr:winged helix-turn-helix domain-containing protein [Terracidiphilus sp.]